MALRNPYPTPSPSANGNTVLFGQDVTKESPKPLVISKRNDEADTQYKWPTPPYDDSEWGASAAASIWAASNRI